MPIIEFPATEKLRELITSVMDSPARLAKVALGSYWHPNHFLKLRVAYLPDGSVLRVHRWALETFSDRPIDQESDIHTHRWSFVSHVLAGVLEIHEFAEAPLPEDTYERYSCRPTEHDHYTLTLEGNTGLIRLRTRILKRGELYHTAPETLHQAFSRSLGTTTIVLQRPASEADSKVYRRPSSPRPESLTEHPSLSEVLRELERVSSLLPGS